MIDQEKRLFRMLRAALRKTWMWYCPRRKAAIEGARLNRSEWRCAEDGKGVPRKEIRVDHVTPCGKLATWDDLPVFARRLFRGELQILCKPHHDEKTRREGIERRKKP